MLLSVSRRTKQPGLRLFEGRPRNSIFSIIRHFSNYFKKKCNKTEIVTAAARGARQQSRKVPAVPVLLGDAGGGSEGETARGGGTPLSTQLGVHAGLCRAPEALPSTSSSLEPPSLQIPALRAEQMAQVKLPRNFTAATSTTTSLSFHSQRLTTPAAPPFSLPSLPSTSHYSTVPVSNRQQPTNGRAQPCRAASRTRGCGDALPAASSSQLLLSQ